jgi:hypothetical protein
MSDSHSYQHPVAQLLLLKETTNWQDEWIDYSARYGLTTADVPELIRLSWDEQPLNCEADEWAVHSLRAIVQLDPDVGLNLYLEQLQKFPDDDYLHEEISGICQRVGAIAIDPLVRLMGDSTHQHQWSRSTAANGLEHIAKVYPECRETCVQALIEQLQRYREEENDDFLNSTLADNLIHLKAVQASSLLADVFENGEIDELLTGTWAAAQVELGLKQESDFSPEELKPTLFNYFLANQPVSKGFGSVKPGNKGKKEKKGKKKKKR